MTKDVLARKLKRLQGYLNDLGSHRDRSAEDIERDPYEVERLLELVVQVTVDILNHELAERSVIPESYRHSFLEAGRLELIPEDLAESPRRSPGQRGLTGPCESH